MSHRWTCRTVAAVAAATLYAVMWMGFALRWKWLQAIDSALMDPLHAYGLKHQSWLRFWDVLCTVLGPEAFQLIGAAVVVVAVLRRHLRAVLFVLMTMELNGVVAQAGKDLAGRARPAGALIAGTSSAFPSGHAVAVMAGVLTLLTVSAGMLTRRARIVAAVIGAIVVLAVGAGRVVLNVHYPSDVVAGWSLGYLWFLVCLVVTRPGSEVAEGVEDRV
ncbi:MAG: phosphatase PAP2 family protein [Mycobacteriaceae bacterium]|nr:phosphatase PAP2 family protein [Mycobacteriaceae bacterium]